MEDKRLSVDGIHYGPRYDMNPLSQRPVSPRVLRLADGRREGADCEARRSWGRKRSELLRWPTEGPCLSHSLSRRRKSERAKNEVSLDTTFGTVEMLQKDDNPAGWESGGNLTHSGNRDASPGPCQRGATGGSGFSSSRIAGFA